MHNLCISCLTEDKHLNQMSTASLETPISTFEIYKLCSGIGDTDMSEFDDQRICDVCLSRLMNAYDFRVQCRTSYATLKGMKSHLVKQGNEQMVKDKALNNETLIVIEKKTRSEPTNDLTSMESVNTMEAEFMCYYCDAILATHNDYMVHREKHVVENTIVAKSRSISRLCYLCGQYQASYVKHLESVHKDFCPNKCKQCSKTFRSPKLLKTHLFMHMETKNFPCLGCHRTFKSHSQRRSHLKLDKHEKDGYRCSVCGLSCEKFMTLHQHFQKEHKSQNTKQLFPCYDCRAVFSYLKYFQQHKCPETGKRRKSVNNLALTASIYPCERCNQRFADEDEMVCHKFTVCSASSQCPECGKVLENRHALQNHLRRHELKGNFICEICAFSACSAPKLALHKAKHEPVDRMAYLKCPHPGCTAELKSDYTLQIHMRRHGESQFECYLCQRKFRHRTAIQRHMTTEHIPAEQLEHVCHCGKRFYTARELKIHERLHNDDRPMRCHLCPNAYRDPANLKGHIRRVHEGIYFECIQCSKRYSERMKMKQHLYTHLGVKAFNCSECPEQFSKRFILIDHLQRVHKTNFDPTLHSCKENEQINEMLKECRRMPKPNIENEEIVYVIQ